MCERCAQLEFENAKLRATLAIKVRADILGRVREGLGVSTQGARLLLLLFHADGQAIAFDTLRDALPTRYTKSADGRRSEHYLRVAIYQLRLAMGEGMVRTVRAVGYCLTPEGVERVRSAMLGETFILGRAA